MNKPLPRAVDLKAAMEAADIDELERQAEAIGRQAIAVALAEGEPPPPERYKPNEDEERERLQDAALADAIEMVNRHRLRLGRRVCSRPDGSTTRRIFELLRAMVGPEGGADNDPSFQ
jgi:hypothetical protein